MPDEVKKEEASSENIEDKLMNGDGKAGEKTPPVELTPEQVAEKAKADEAAAAEKPAEEKPKAPEKYELKLPDGSLLEATEIEKIASFAKERGLSNDEAQAMLNDRNTLLESYAGKQKKVWETETGKWMDQSKADTEIGGDAFEKNAELAKRVVTRFGTPALMEGLNATGFGNHPELVRMMVRIGKAMDEDQLVLPGSKAPAAEKEMADVFYGGTTKDK